MSTNWQHVQCTIFPPTIKNCEALNGFSSLPEDKQNLIRERVTSSSHEVDLDNIPIDPNELVRKTWNKELEPVNELLMPLLPYQKEGLGWMVNQERSAVRGGILADEMGKHRTAHVTIHSTAQHSTPHHTQHSTTQHSKRQHIQHTSLYTAQHSPYSTRHTAHAITHSTKHVIQHMTAQLCRFVLWPMIINARQHYAYA